MCHSETVVVPAEQPNVPTRVSGYDRINAGLVAALLLTSGLVLLLAAIWLDVSKTRVPDRDPLVTSPAANLKIPLEPLEIAIPDPASTGLPLGVEATLGESLLAVIRAVSTIEARLESDGRQSLEQGIGRRSGFPDGIPRHPWPGAGGPEWLVVLEAPSRGEYVAMLEAMGLEIAALEMASEQVDRVDLTDGIATLMNSSRHEMRELQMTFLAHQNPRLQAWDRELLFSAGRKSFDTCIVGQLYPPAVIAELAQLESAFAEARGWKAAEIRRTVFRVVGNAGKYRFEVESQERRR